MADTKISDLSEATSLAGTDEFVIATSGATKRVTFDTLVAEFPFSAPEPVAGMLAHYSAADTGSLTIVSNKVSAWNDLSGNGHNLGQGTAGVRPLYNGTPRTINGITCPEFTGTEFMTSTCPMDDRTFSVFAVFQTDSVAGNKCLVGDSAGGGFELRLAGAVWQHLKSVVAILATSSLGVANSRPNFYCSRMDAANHYFNWPGDAVNTVVEATTFTAGRTLKVGLDQSGTVAWDGLIAELIFYNTTLTLDECSQNFSYLASVWA